MSAMITLDIYTQRAKLPKLNGKYEDAAPADVPPGTRVARKVRGAEAYSCTSQRRGPPRNTCPSMFPVHPFYEGGGSDGSAGGGGRRKPPMVVAPQTPPLPL